MTISSVLKRLSNRFRHPISEDLFFLHIPKCGGTSLRRAMSAPYRARALQTENSVVHIHAAPMLNAMSMLAAEVPALEVAYLEEYLLLYFMNRNQTRFIDGHIPFPSAAHSQLSNRFRFITILRDPVERWISEYSYNRFHGSTHMRDTASVPISDYLESEFGQGQGCQYVLYIGGRRPDRDYLCRSAIDNALDNLEKFELIGCVEAMQQFQDAFYARFGWRLQLAKLNASPSPDGFVGETFTAEIRERIRQICAPDYQIYDEVLKKAGA